MKPGDLVQFRLDSLLEGSEVGLVIRELDLDEKLRDPFPMFFVLFPRRGLLRCRGTDLCKPGKFRVMMGS